MPKTLIFTATFNEKGNIENLINQINLILNDVDILIVDDNSYYHQQSKYLHHSKLN